MKSFKAKKQSLFMKAIAIPLITFLCILAILLFGINNMNALSDEQERKLTHAALKKAIIQCYANEGFYPAELGYLEDNYYLRIDHDKYYVYYECFSSNIMPEFDVFEK